MSTSLASPIARPSVGRTFIVAITLLGALALTELGAVGWVFVKRFHALTERAKLGPGRVAADDSGVRPGDLASTATNDVLDTKDPFGEGSTSLEPIAPPQKPVPISATRLNQPQAPPETRFQELVVQARQLRDRGDTGAALTRLREAQTLEPQNPEAIAETAITYEKMTLLDRAGEQWRRLYEMGSAAGAFYLAAESRMKMSQAQALAAVQMAQQGASGDGKLSSIRSDAILGIGEISRVERPESGGTRFTLRIPIKARSDGERISVADVDIQVFFYDQVNEDSIVSTDADLSYRFASSPIDWSGSDPETLEVEYSRQPPLPTPKKKPDPKAEQRTFYGYIVRVYFKGDLQDARAEPANLAERFPPPKALDTKTK